MMMSMSWRMSLLLTIWVYEVFAWDNDDDDVSES